MRAAVTQSRFEAQQMMLGMVHDRAKTGVTKVV
jgi:hypothetical protein